MPNSQGKNSRKARSSNRKTNKNVKSNLRQISTHANENRQSARERYLRRLACNTRERNRMEDLNIAFHKLRGVIPQVSGECRRYTKLETLTLARNYIISLTNVITELQQVLRLRFGYNINETPQLVLNSEGSESPQSFEDSDVD